MNTQVDWSGLRERVIAVQRAELRARDRDPSDYLGFDPVLTPAEIAEVEAEYGVALPAEYRGFLAEVGAGGPGPALHLSPLRKVDGRWVWEHDGYPWQLDPSGPFVESEGWAAQQLATLRAAGYEPATPYAEDGHLDDYREVFGDAGDERWFLERGRGAVLISDNGCGMTSWLILVGPHRGELRDRDCDLNPPFEPYVDAEGNPHNFHTWYLEWLERRERAVR